MQAHGGDSGNDKRVRGWVKAGKKFGAKASKGAWTWVTEVGGKLDVSTGCRRAVQPL